MTIGEDAPARRSIIITGRRYGAERLVSDGMHFADCRFEGTTFVYFGGPPPIFQDCLLREVSFDFGGPANNTAKFLKSLIEQKIIRSI